MVFKSMSEWEEIQAKIDGIVLGEIPEEDRTCTPPPQAAPSQQVVQEFSIANVRIYGNVLSQNGIENLKMLTLSINIFGSWRIFPVAAKILNGIKRSDLLPVCDNWGVSNSSGKKKWQEVLQFKAPRIDRGIPDTYIYYDPSGITCLMTREDKESLEVVIPNCISGRRLYSVHACQIDRIGAPFRSRRDGGLD
jgi:hypothetical protein